MNVSEVFIMDIPKENFKLLMKISEIFTIETSFTTETRISQQIRPSRPNPREPRLTAQPAKLKPTQVGIPKPKPKIPSPSQPKQT